MRKTVALLGTLACCALMATLFFAMYEEKIEAEEEEAAPEQAEFVPFTPEQIDAHGIQLYQVSNGQLKRIVRAPAKISICSDRLVHVLPKTSGVALEAYKNLGERVEQGEVLARLESREAAEVKSDYLRALKKAKLATSTFNREHKLYEKQISTMQEFCEAENNLAQALIDSALTCQKLYTIGLQQHEIVNLPFADPQSLRIYEVRSPIAGEVVNRHITPGEVIDQNHEIYTVANLQTLWAEISLYAKDRGLVREGQEICITSLDGHCAKSMITYLSPLLNAETYRSEAIAEIDNGSKTWLPGTFAHAELIAGTEAADMIIPKTAVHQIDGEMHVFVAQENGFVVRPVALGRSDESYYEVLSGIQLGDLVAAKNSFLLKAELKKAEAEHMD